MAQVMVQSREQWGCAIASGQRIVSRLARSVITFLVVLLARMSRTRVWALKGRGFP